VVEYLLCKLKVLSSNHSPTKKKKSHEAEESQMERGPLGGGRQTRQTREGEGGVNVIEIHTMQV
jgi:hypothetical protein